MIKAGLALALALNAAQPATERWTWTLYEPDGGSSPVVLANEIPDTAALRVTLECEQASGVVAVTLYETGNGRAGFLQARSGQAQASLEGHVQPLGDGALSVSLPADHPVFVAFTESGDMILTQADRRWPVQVTPNHRTTLARFASLCAH